jgi:hypothetical protein
MESEQLQNFNERLSQWVASQGFWFQVGYSMSGTGMKGRAMFHLLRLGFRLLVFLLVVSICVWVWLVKRTDSARFNAALRSDLQQGLSASELDMRGFGRLQGQLEISRLAAEGGNDTFFTSLEGRNIRCKMGLVDGLMGIWKPGIISLARLEVDLRAGSDDEASARKLGESIFRKSGKVEVNTLEAADATFRWGYSERTQGAIESSSLKMQRTDTGWRMNFKGGSFSQNWLKQLEIVNLVVVCEPGGLIFEKAEFRQGDGSVDLSGLRVIGGERPVVEGVAKIRGLVLENIVPPALRSFIEGSLSGDFKVFGSTNTSDGIGFEGQVVLDGTDVISLRERIHLLKALSVVDYSRNYHRIDFREGTFSLKTLRGGMELTDVKLKSDDLFSLEGQIRVRLPTDQEVQDAVAKGSGVGASSIFSADDESAQASEEASAKSESAFSLKRAAQEARRVKEGTQNPDSLTLFDRLGLSIEMRRLQSQASERMSRMLRYEGNVRITVPGDAFERAPRLQALYPVDDSTGRIPMRVPLEGNLYELTLKQAEDIYLQGQR